MNLVFSAKHGSLPCPEAVHGRLSEAPISISALHVPELCDRRGSCMLCTAKRVAHTGVLIHNCRLSGICVCPASSREIRVHSGHWAESRACPKSPVNRIRLLLATGRVSYPSHGMAERVGTRLFGRRKHGTPDGHRVVAALQCDDVVSKPLEFFAGAVLASTCRFAKWQFARAPIVRLRGNVGNASFKASLWTPRSIFLGPFLAGTADDICLRYNASRKVHVPATIFSFTRKFI